MNEAGWMHRDVSAGNCLLSCDPEDGPSFVSDIELSKKMGSKAPASETAISVSRSGSGRDISLTIRRSVLPSLWRVRSSSP
jgi:hypothetical protein